MTDAAPRPLWRRIGGSVWFHLLAAFVVFGLLLTFVAKPYAVPSASMDATLQNGDRILVNRLAYVGAAPGMGDVVVFDAGAAWDGGEQPSGGALKDAARWVGEVTGFGPTGPHTLVKRIIGLPGQRVACCSAEGAVEVDGTPLAEDYVSNDLPFVPGSLDCATEARSPRCFDEVVVPAGSYLVLGDNRGNSSDSAAFCRAPGADDGCWRWATRDGLVGRAAAVIWPIPRWAGL
ncbi:signal peptidase I [Microbacterium lemovicicum]|uniref:signal peptidase I n=1 Tax=Microbacterium lemovicicum TaxID=1072463 RepID=UPI0013DEEC7F|nr:signal peptidase I [Microbacterium lemovicicum]